MKIFFFLFTVILISVSCDPYQLVYIKNYSEKNLQLSIQFEKQASDFTNFNIPNCDTFIENPKSLLNYKFEKLISPTLTSDTTYIVYLPAKSISRLSPLTIGFPINKILISSENMKDSLLFYRLNSNIKEQIELGRLQKVNMAFFIYSFK
jgi:hypothetical protein